MVTRARVEQQAAIVDAIAAKAAEALSGIGGMEFAGMVDAGVAVSRAYTQLSAAVTATYYNEIRTQSKVRRKYTATAYSGFDENDAERAFQAIVAEYVAGNATVPIAQLYGDAAGRFVKDGADYCIRENARRDPAKPRYAIVPNGDACAFCIMRASNGYTYPSEDKGIKSHNHCTCVATPVFGKDKVEGYDVDMYRNEWEEADRAYRSGDISDELKQRIEHQQRLKGDGFDTTNAVLMVMREQQGIS